MSDLISIGKIINFHGIKGEVKLGYSKGSEDRLLQLKSVFTELGGQKIILNISSMRFHKNFAIVKFKEINSINDFEPFKGAILKIEQQAVIQNLEDDEFLISDLEGLSVFDSDGVQIGKIAAVGENKANNLLSVKSKKDGKIYLVPFIKELVPKVDLEGKRVIINNIEGLIG